MTRRISTLFFSLVLMTSYSVYGTSSADTITLDLSKSLNPTSFEYTEKGNWKETYNESEFSFMDFNTFSFSHLIGQNNSYGYYWDGFTMSVGSDITNYAEEGESGGWVPNQWNSIAGGGIKTDANGKVVKDAAGNVVAEAGIPYLVAYWGFYSESNGMHSLQVIFNEGGSYHASGVYISNHTWPYYGNIYGDGFAREFEEGDYFKLIIHALDENLEDTGKSVEYTLAEYKGSLKQSDKWEWVDLSSLGEVGGFYFTMETTDSDPEYGPNTAAYFCLDKLQVYTPSGSVGILSNTNEARISIYSDYIKVESDKNELVEIYNTRGERVAFKSIDKGVNTIDTSHLPQGIYVLKCGSTTQKITK